MVGLDVGLSQMRILSMAWQPCDLRNTLAVPRLHEGEYEGMGHVEENKLPVLGKRLASTQDQCSPSVLGSTCLQRVTQHYYKQERVLQQGK